MATRETEAVERFDCDIHTPPSSALAEAFMEPDDDGDWVRYEDYERVREERDQVTDRNLASELQWHEEHIDEAIALEAQIADDSKAEIATWRNRAKAAAKRVAKAEVRAKQAQALLTQLLEAVEEHQESSKPFRDQWLYKAASEIREQSGSREG